MHTTCFSIQPPPHPPCWSRGLCVICDACWEANPRPPPCGQTNTCDNITLLQISFAAVNIPSGGSKISKIEVPASPGRNANQALVSITSQNPSHPFPLLGSANDVYFEIQMKIRSCHSKLLIKIYSVKTKTHCGRCGGMSEKPRGLEGFLVAVDEVTSHVSGCFVDSHDTGTYGDHLPIPQ